MLDQIIEEQKALVISGQLPREHFGQAVRSAVLGQKREEALFRMGRAERPGRNWRMMEDMLARQADQDRSFAGDVTRGTVRNFRDIATGGGQLLWQLATSPVRAAMDPVGAAKYVLGDSGRLVDPAAWREAYGRTVGPGEELSRGNAPRSLSELLQQVVAQTGRGYADLADDPVGRFRKDPLYTALDVLPLWSLAARGAAGAGIVGRTAAGVSKAAFPEVIKGAGRGAMRFAEGNKYLAPAAARLNRAGEALRHKIDFGNVESRSLSEHFAGRRGDRQFVEKYVRPIEKRLDKDRPGQFRAILERRASPVGLPRQEARDLTAAVHRINRRVERRHTQPGQQILGKFKGTREGSDVPVTVYRRRAPVIDVMTDNVKGERQLLREVPEARLVEMADELATVRVDQIIDVRNLTADVVREFGDVQLKPVPGLKAPRRVKGSNVIEYDPQDAVYLQDFAQLQGARTQDFMPVAPRASDQVSLPSGKRRMGGQDVPMVQSVSEILERQFAQMSRVVHNKQLQEDVLANFRRELVLPGGAKIHKVKRHELLGGEITDAKGNVLLAAGADIEQLLAQQGLSAWSPASQLRFYRAQLDLTDSITSKLRKAGSDQVKIDEIVGMLSDELTPETIKKFVSYMGVAKNDEAMFFLPKQIVSELNKRIEPRGLFMKFFVDKPLDVWRPLVLGTPRWIINNVVGNFMLNTLRGVGPLSYARALKSFWEDWQGKHGRGAYGQLDIIPEQVKRGFVASEIEASGKRMGDIGRTGELGEFVAGAAGKIVNAPGIRHAVAAYKPYLNLIQRINSGVEDVFRRANYLRGAYPAARRQLMERVGEGAVTSQALMDELHALARSAAPFDPIVTGIRTGRDLMETGVGHQLVGTVNEFLFDYSKLTPFERRVMRSLFPFYSWYKNILGLIGKLPVKYPGRSKMMEMLTGVGREMEADGPAGENLPEYLRSAVTGSTRQGRDMISGEPGAQTRFWMTRGMNPLETVSEASNWPNMINPMLRAMVETIASKDLLTGRPLEREGLERDLLTGEYSRVGPRGVEQVGRFGGPKMFAARLAQQAGPLRELLDLAAGGRPRYGDTFFKAIPGQPQRKQLGRTVMSYLGFPFTDINMERAAKSMRTRRRREVSQHFKQAMKVDPDRLRKLAYMQ